MDILITKDVDSYIADILDLCGSPPTGIGRTAEEAIAMAVIQMLYNKNYVNMIDTNYVSITYK